MKQSLEILTITMLLLPACDVDQATSRTDSREPEPVARSEQPCRFDPDAPTPAPVRARGVREPTWRVEEDQRKAGLRAVAPITAEELAAARAFSATHVLDRG